LTSVFDYFINEAGDFDLALYIQKTLSGENEFTDGDIESDKSPKKKGLEVLDLITNLQHGIKNM